MNIADLKTVSHIRVEPSSDGMTDVFAKIGYSLADALADVIDNSIDAGAKNILIQLNRTSDALHRIAIVDDGCGMTGQKLDEIMQFGVKTQHKSTDLGKYGIGLKTASFSKCAAFTVVSRFGGAATARRWSKESARRDWSLEIVDDQQAAAFWRNDWSPIATDTPTGTIVVWDKLQPLVPHRENFDSAIARLRTSLAIDLGLRFHRFISSKRVSIQIREANQAGNTSVAQTVHPYDPFDYSGKSGATGYPITFQISVGEGIPLKLEAHVWPPKSNSDNYKLGGGAVVKRQGFYFYRNDRLIQAGGWQGYKSEEPHSSLARVRVELPAQLDSQFQLTVQKHGCIPPPDFIDQLRNSDVFARYLETSQETYRNAPAESKAIAVPGSGLPRAAASALRKLVASTQSGAPKKTIDIEWKKLKTNAVFKIDLSRSAVVLNTEFRTRIIGGGKQSQDGAAFKTLLFMSLRDLLTYERSGKRVQQRADELNEALLRVLRSTR